LHGSVRSGLSSQNAPAAMLYACSIGVLDANEVSPHPIAAERRHSY
jgi:hypothetical protein